MRSGRGKDHHQGKNVQSRQIRIDSQVSKEGKGMSSSSWLREKLSSESKVSARAKIEPRCEGMHIMKSRLVNRRLARAHRCPGCTSAQSRYRTRFTGERKIGKKIDRSD